MSDYFVEVTEVPNSVEVGSDITYVDISGGGAPTQVAVAETIEHVEVQEDPHSIITEPAGRSVYIVDFLHIQVYS
jgi:hypothetical protein